MYYIMRNEITKENKVEKVKCSKCGKEVKEFMETGGRILCKDCYAEEAGSIEMPEAGGG
jgi:NMD protein affecting ribosome stability and mRNA decay